jgi:molybdopterin molybdotransferase
MISLFEALDIFKTISFSHEFLNVNFMDASGYVLAEDLYSDIDMPPFDKSAVDGYACRMCDLKNPLKVIEFVPAGTLPLQRISENTCIKIMTGAKVPDGADCIIMIEDTITVAENIIKFSGKNTKSNICYRGEDLQTGQKVAEKGSIITPAVIAVAASIGKTKLRVSKPPKVALMATGDEIIEPDNIPSGPFIRNSNPYNLMAQIEQAPASVDYLGIIPDNEPVIKEKISTAVKNFDILIITGGVSMGERDYVAGILKSMGFTIAYEKLAIQPGKPVVFAFKDKKFCFALSGNPVSSMFQFELLVRPFIYMFMGHNYKLPIIKAKINAEFIRKKTERLQFFPIRLENGNAIPIEFHGSAHITGLIGASGLGLIEPGKATIEKNEEIDILLLKY